MPSRVNRFVRLPCALVVLGALFIAHSAWAGAQEDQRREQRERERGRFAVGVAITSGILIAQQNGQIDSTANVDQASLPCFSFPFCNPLPVGDPNHFNSASVPSPIVSPEPFGQPVLGAANTVSPNLGLNIELMTPALEILPGKPRFFGTFEILPTFASETSVAVQGVGNRFIIPDQAPITFQAPAIAGTGSRVEAEVMTTVLAANIGAAFAFELRDRVVRIKPSVGWLRWGVIAEGRVLDAYKDDAVRPQNRRPIYGAHIRLVELSGRGSAFFNAVGPGLEVEMELDKRGSFRPVLYASGFAYRTVGDEPITFKAAKDVSDELGNARYAADWAFWVDDWSYRAGIGFRLRWVGD